MKTLKSYFASLRASKRFGAVSADRENDLRAKVFARIGEYERSAGYSFAAPNAEKAVAAFRPDYATYFFQNFISKPVVASAASFVILAGGWLTTVSAADSLPGDTLYNVKLITERAQLKLASLDQRAELHTEFAERRLQEVNALQEAAKNEPERATLIRQTVNAYQEQLASATQDLRQLQQENESQAVAVASSVREQMDAITASLPEEVVDVDNATQEAQQAATNVAVEIHEKTPSELSKREIEAMFKRDLGDVEARQTLLLNRMLRIESLLVQEKTYLAQQGVVVMQKTELAAMQEDVEEMSLQISSITSGFVAGGYRTALDNLQKIKTDFHAYEVKLTEVEFNLTQALAQKPKPEAEIETQTVPDTANGSADAS